MSKLREITPEDASALLYSTNQPLQQYKNAVSETEFLLNVHDSLVQADKVSYELKSLDGKEYTDTATEKEESATEKFFKAAYNEFYINDDTLAEVASQITPLKSNSLLPKPSGNTLDLSSSEDKLASTDILDQLKNHPELERIVLDDSLINDLVLEKIALYCPKIKSLSFANCPLSSISSKGLMQLRKLKEIKSLCFSGTLLNDNLTDLLPIAAPKLESIDLSNVNFGSSYISRYDYEFLNNFSYLKHLDLSNPIAELNCNVLLAISDLAFSLKSLNLENSYLFTDSDKTLESKTLSLFRKLEALNLRGTNVGDEVLGSLLLGLPKLKKLSIDRESITQIESLKGFKNLEVLNIDGEDFDLDSLNS